MTTTTPSPSPRAALLRVARAARTALGADDVHELLEDLLREQRDAWALEVVAAAAADALAEGASPADVAALVDGVVVGDDIALRTLWVRDDTTGTPLQLEGEPADREGLEALVDAAAEDAADEGSAALDRATLEASTLVEVEVTCWAASTSGRETVRGEASRTVHPYAPDPCGVEDEDHQWRDHWSQGAGGARMLLTSRCARCGAHRREDYDRTRIPAEGPCERLSYTPYGELDEDDQDDAAREALGRVADYVEAEDVGPSEAAEATLAGGLLTEVLYLLDEEDDEDEEGVAVVSIPQVDGGVRLLAVPADQADDSGRLPEASTVLGAVDLYADGALEWAPTGPRRSEWSAEVAEALREAVEDARAE